MIPRTKSRILFSIWIKSKFPQSFRKKERYARYYTTRETTKLKFLPKTRVDKEKKKKRNRGRSNRNDDHDSLCGLEEGEEEGGPPLARNKVTFQRGKTYTRPNSLAHAGYAHAL